VVDAPQAGCGRWKLANANHNVLKTKGEQLEPHFGHGNQSRAALLLSLNLLALLCHPGVEWREAQYVLLRQTLARRQTLFHDIQALRRSMIFDSWEPVMAFRPRGLELASQVNTS
jgi:hypothetical protein